jgi:hypothetical protein
MATVPASLHQGDDDPDHDRSEKTPEDKVLEHPIPLLLAARLAGTRGNGPILSAAGHRASGMLEAKKARPEVGLFLPVRCRISACLRQKSINPVSA